MYLINEKNDVSVSLYLANKTFYTALELTAELSASYKAGQIQQPNLFILQSGRNIALNDALCNAFCNRSFTYTCFTNQAGLLFRLADRI